MQQRIPVATLSAATLVIVVVALGAIVLGRTGPSSGVGASPAIPSPTNPPASPSARKSSSSSACGRSRSGLPTSWNDRVQVGLGLVPTFSHLRATP